MRRILSRDPITGVETWFEMDTNGEIRFVNTQDVTHIVEHAKDRHNATQNHIREEFRHVAYVPMLTYMDWVTQGKDTDGKFIKKWANDIDNRHLRTGGGRV
jgi:hypothetical protein